MLNNTTTKAPQNNESGISDVIAKYLAYWPLFIFFFLISVCGAFFYLRYAIPKYEADATIIIKDDKKGDGDSQLMQSLDAINGKKIIENEIEVLQSRSLMDKVVKKLHLYAPISQKGKINNISAYVLSPLVIEARSPDSLREVKKISLEYDAKKGTVLLDKSFSGTINQWLNTPYGVLRFLPNDKYVHVVQDEEKPFFFSLNNVKSVTEGVLNGLKVAASNKLSSVIDISYRDEVPKRAEDMLNELIKSYTEASLDEKNNLAKNTLAFIEQRLSVVSKDLDAIEAKLQQYKAGRGAVDISQQGRLYLENVSQNDKKLSDLNIQLGTIEQLEKYASSPGSSGVLPSTLGVTDPTLSSQVSTLSNLQMQYEKLKGTVAENNPVLLSLTGQINQLRPNILSNVQNLRQSLEQSKSSIAATGGTYNNILSAIPQKERQLVEITRDQNIKNGIYSFLLQKREDTELSYASNIPDSRVVNYAQSGNLPVSPKKMMIYVIALVIGLGLPIGIITAREIFSPKILYRNEIEAMTKMPVIGEIAYNTKSKKSKPLVIQPAERSIMAEEFRKIRVSLLSLGIDSTHKKLLITSSISGEGKSFIAANLATSISLTGKKVVLVDMDLHNPGLGKFFGIKEQPGVSEYLLGKKQVSQIIYHIPGNENLFYVSSGLLQQDSSELLENGKVQSLIARLDKDFDMVIIDVAPIVLVTDAYLLSSLCDATLYVITHKVTPKVLVKRIDNSSIVNPIKNPAVVFNGVKQRGFFKSKNSGYGYNYVYGYNSKKNKKSLKTKFSGSNSI